MKTIAPIPKTKAVLPYGTPVVPMKVTVTFRDTVKRLAEESGMSMSVYLEQLGQKISA